MLLAVGGCDDEQGVGSPGHRDAPTPGISASGSASSPGASFRVRSRYATTDAVDAVPGREFQVSFSLSGTTAPGRTLNHLGLTPDGQMITAANPAATTRSGEVVIGQSQVGLYAGSRVRGMSPAPHGAARQAIYGDADERTVAWLETTSTDMYQMDWRVYGFDRAAGRTVLLGDSAAVSKGRKMPIPPGSSMLSVGTDRVYWTTAVPTTGQPEFGAQVLGRSVTGSRAAEVVAERAKLPAAAGSDLYYVRSADVSPGFPADRYEIRKVTGGRDDLLTTGPLAKEQQVTALTAEPGRVAWIVSAPAPEPNASLFVLDTATGDATEVTLGDDGTSMTLSSSPRYVCWSNGSGGGDAGQYALDVRTQRLWRLGEAPGLSLVFAAGDYLAWSKLGAEPQKPDQNSLTVARLAATGG
ncbi:hypothetical protein AB0B63_22440 [Micromonospora sp. NPDC049081]|uniref:hypothetical protein n=1 Tax=Micromonospora sp. NPDC049081 TaxID=3155150 RepID=UPI00340CAAA1